MKQHYLFAELLPGKEAPPAVRQSVHLKLSRQRYLDLLHTDWLVARELSLRSATRSVHVMLLDRTSASVGSITLPVTTPR